MESKKAIFRTIQRLKEIKDQHGLTYSLILEKMERKGYPISESTIKRVFAAGSEDKHFRYQDSIAPIAEVLFEEYGDTSSTEDVALLRQDIRERDKTIEQLLIKIENMEKMERMYEERRKMFEAQIQRLNDQIDRKDAIIERLIGEILPSPEK